MTVTEKLWQGRASGYVSTEKQTPLSETEENLSVEYQNCRKNDRQVR